MKKQEGPPLSGLSPSQPQNIYHKSIFKAYCLIIPATITIHDGCVQSSMRAFSITGHRKAKALKKAEVWVDTVKQGGQRFMAAWRK